MRIICDFTKRCLLQNRIRTLVTIIGIILSTSLFTAVIEGAVSGVGYLARCEADANGSWEGCFYDLDAAAYDALKEDPAISSYASMAQVGWAEIGSYNKYKPYLLIQAVDGEIGNMTGVTLLAGRMPENDSELLISAHLSENGGVTCRLGDTLTLSVGKRTTEGYELDAQTGFLVGEEEITDAEEKTYRVVGIMKRLSDDPEAFSCPGYTAYTKGEGSGKLNAYFNLRQPKRFFSFMDKQTYSDQWGSHGALLRYEGSAGNSNVTGMIYGFAGVLVCLIFFGSVSLIYNSFAISVNERIRLFGILKSIGATKKQIRGSVFYEASLLSLIGIPIGLLLGCAGIGTTLWCLKDYFWQIVGMEDSKTRMKLVLSPKALLLCCLICFITVLVSAYIPAKRVIRLSPIESIRQTGEITIRSSEVKIPAFLSKNLGFDGMMALKNFKRNRKRNRSVVLSLFASVVLFISASSLCSYLSTSVGGISQGSSSSDLIYYMSHDAGEKASLTSKELLSRIKEISSVEKACFLTSRFQSVSLPAEAADDSYLSYPGRNEEADGKIDMDMDVTFIDDDTFREILKANGLDSKDFFDENAPKGVIYNRSVVEYQGENDASTKRYEFAYLKSSALPVTASFRLFRDEIGDYVSFEPVDDGSGDYMYLEESELARYNSDEITREEINPDCFRRIPLSESSPLVELTVAAEIKDVVFPFGNDACIFYPGSMIDAVFGGYSDDFLYGTDFYMKAADHADAFIEVQKLLVAEGFESSSLADRASRQESSRMMVTVINVFSFGFIILISLIAVTNVFNTISTSLILRRREYAMLRSVGLDLKRLRRMMRFECLLYGLKSLLWGIPVSLLVTYRIWMITESAYVMGFYVPLNSILIAVGSVFLVVFTSMTYAGKQIEADNPLDALRNENV